CRRCDVMSLRAGSVVLCRLGALAQRDEGDRPAGLVAAAEGTGRPRRHLAADCVKPDHPVALGAGLRPADAGLLLAGFHSPLKGVHSFPFRTASVSSIRSSRALIASAVTALSLMSSTLRAACKRTRSEPDRSSVRSVLVASRAVLISLPVLRCRM